MLQFIQDHVPYFILGAVLLFVTLMSVIFSDGAEPMAGPPPD